MRAVVLLLLPLGGCQWVFSPSPTGAATADADPLQPDADPLQPDAAPPQPDAESCSADADEDADGVTDRCDLCPHLVDTGVDSDHDSVGDTCDPHPATAIDELSEFVAFDMMPAGWEADGTWMVGTGRLSGSGQLGNLTRFRRTAPIDTTGSIEVELALPSVAQAIVAGIEIQRDDAPNGVSLLCVVEDSGGDDLPHIKVYELANGILQDRTTGVGPVQPRGDAFRLRAGYDSFDEPGVFCEHDGAAVTFTLNRLSEFTLGGVGYVLTKAQRGATFDATWAVVITQP